MALSSVENEDAEASNAMLLKCVEQIQADAVRELESRTAALRKALELFEWVPCALGTHPDDNEDEPPIGLCEPSSSTACDSCVARAALAFGQGGDGTKEGSGT